MATAPFQLWLDGAAIATAVRVSSTVTITTSSAHGIVTGSYVQMAGFSGTAGSTMNGVFEATVTSGTAFTYTAAGNAGTAVTAISLTSEVFSVDILNPLLVSHHPRPDPSAAREGKHRRNTRCGAGILQGIYSKYHHAAHGLRAGHDY